MTLYLNVCLQFTLNLSDIQGAISKGPLRYADATLQEATYDIIHLEVNDVQNNQSHDQMT